MCRDTNTCRKSMVSILGFKHRYVNVPIRARQEKYPFLGERETEEESDGRTQIYIIASARRERNKWKPTWERDGEERAECTRVQLRTIIAASSPLNLIIKYVCQRHRCSHHLPTALASGRNELNTHIWMSSQWRKRLLWHTDSLPRFVRER